MISSASAGDFSRLNQTVTSAVDGAFQTIGQGVRDVGDAMNRKMDDYARNRQERQNSQTQDESKGYRTYKRVGMLKPVAGKIWDNRYGALEEAEMHKAAAAAGKKTKSKEADAEGGDAYLTSTTFEIISGAGDIHEGMLIREAVIKH